MPELWGVEHLCRGDRNKGACREAPVPGIMEGNKIRPVLLRDITTEEEARIDLKMM